MIGALIAKQKVKSGFAALNRRDFLELSSGLRDDCVFIFPGNLPVSGEMKGKAAVENWLKKFIDQFQKVNFTLTNICVDNIFDFVGTNTIAAHWDLSYTNRDGKEVQNTGITIFKAKFGKVYFLKDYIFDPEEKLKAAWGIE